MIESSGKGFNGRSTANGFRAVHYSEADHLYRNIGLFADTVLFEYSYPDGQMQLSSNARGQLDLEALEHFFVKHRDNAPKAGEIQSFEICLGKMGEPYHWCCCKLCAKWGEDGKQPVSLMGKLQDISKLKKREEQLMLQSTKDGLTGVYNKTAFEYRVEKKMKGGKKGWLCMIDIDNFKEINDSFGHPAGDRILEQIGAVLCQLFPEPDLIGRVGGDEFVVFTSTSDVHQRAKDFLEQVERIVPEEEGRLSASIGIVTCTGMHKDDYQELFSQADRAMYRAKTSGKNRIAFLHNDPWIMT